MIAREALLEREVPCRTVDRGRVVGRVIVGLFGAAMVTGLAVGPRRMMACCMETPREIASATTKKYAYDAFPSWQNAHPDEQCPVCLHELNEYMNNKDIRDPWGKDYEMYCGDFGILVRSFGEDGVAGNGDDVWSR